MHIYCWEVVVVKVEIEINSKAVGDRYLRYNGKRLWVVGV